MGRFQTYSGVVQLLVLLHTATVIVSLDKAEFSDRFRQVVDNVLGVQQYKVTVATSLCVIHFHFTRYRTI